ncbi:patatin-like phospholipase family protein [Sinorhizobium medicae]|uniref:patatin-like phospholipase family protein n=1 Tax=Sinorhizobium medicae TaxID=110321 RepID=UPI001F3AB863|nr:patatin-like phospholipase family protein [Sinorhizobium medicae]
MKMNRSIMSMRSGVCRRHVTTAQFLLAISRSAKVMIIVLTGASVFGCTSDISRKALPEAEVVHAHALVAPSRTDPTIRIWGDEKPKWFEELIGAPPSALKRRFPGIFGRPHAYLALSGGGQNGAYGAGLLNGWTAAGNRPEFTMVTGISTGSLIAPFAFLGPDYDDELTEVYTKYSTKDLVKKRPFLSILAAASAADTAPLRRVIARYVDADMIAKIAAEHRQGRRLFIGMTNLDAGRPVLWDIGAIANSSDPGAADLIHDVLLASAAIPGAFPPVLINVKADGETFDELHVDGGTTTQVFLYPAGIDWRKVTSKLKVPGRPDVYVIRNASLNPVYDPVKPGLIPIAGRSISALIRTQGVGDMYRIYLGAKRDGLDYHLALIPDEFDVKSEEPFDANYMRQLYKVGYEHGKSGRNWLSAPPGFE